LLRALGRYCAFRAATFGHDGPQQLALEEMAHINLERATGTAFPKIHLEVERPVIADARMMPHEWIQCSTGKLLKVDASSHGDDHFYPGPTDIAWDLAGAIVEWQLGQESADLVINEYESQSHDHIRSRLSPYLLAYCAFRLASAQSAFASLSDQLERGRFELLCEIYRARIARVVERVAAA
jgi:hypothetical protein